MQRESWPVWWWPATPLLFMGRSLDSIFEGYYWFHLTDPLLVTLNSFVSWHRLTVSELALQFKERFFPSCSHCHHSAHHSQCTQPLHRYSMYTHSQKVSLHRLHEATQNHRQKVWKGPSAYWRRHSVWNSIDPPHTMMIFILSVCHV